MKPFSEEMRYEYPLTPDSLVVDAGAHKGTFSREISKRYDCDILAYEPIREFYDEAVQNQSPKTEVFKAGLGGSDRTEVFEISGDSTGMYGTSGREETVIILDVTELFPSTQINLFKINIEGMEYELLERMLETGMIPRIENLQVQFHRNVDNYHDRRLSIMEKLAETHLLTYEYPYVWENWRLRP